MQCTCNVYNTERNQNQYAQINYKDFRKISLAIVTSDGLGLNLIYSFMRSWACGCSGKYSVTDWVMKEMEELATRKGGKNA